MNYSKDFEEKIKVISAIVSNNKQITAITNLKPFQKVNGKIISKCSSFKLDILKKSESIDKSTIPEYLKKQVSLMKDYITSEGDLQFSLVGMDCKSLWGCLC